MVHTAQVYVSMPIGKKIVASGHELDFDRIYLEAVQPAARAVGLQATRSDSLVSIGTIGRAMIEAVARSEFALFDLSVPDGDVFYALGLRHALVPHATVVMTAEGSRVPFDLRSLGALIYGAQGGPSDTELHQLRNDLTGILSLKRDRPDLVDSPFFQLFNVEPIAWPDDPLGIRATRAKAEALRARLLEARQLLPEEALPRLRELEKAFAESDADDERLHLDLMLAYRDCGAWDEVIRLAKSFPAPLRDNPVVVQQSALARNRRGLPGDADRAAADLEALIGRLGPDSETYGLLGRIHKDRWQRTKDRQYLDAAIDAYRRGWAADPEDVYPGINLATLLTVAGGEAAEEEARSTAAALRAVVDGTIASRPPDYWDVATALELAVIARDWARAEELVPEARTRAASAWMAESTANNVRMLAEAMADRQDQRQALRVVRDLTPGASTP